MFLRKGGEIQVLAGVPPTSLTVGSLLGTPRPEKNSQKILTKSEFSKFISTTFHRIHLAKKSANLPFTIMLQNAYDARAEICLFG
jgi:hypothetical protein